MPVRAICNFVYVYLRPSGDGVTQEDLDKWDDQLYAHPDDDGARVSLITQLGG